MMMGLVMVRMDMVLMVVMMILVLMVIMLVPRYTNKKKSGNCRKKEARAATSPRASERKASTCS